MDAALEKVISEGGLLGAVAVLALLAVGYIYREGRKTQREFTDYLKLRVEADAKASAANAEVLVAVTNTLSSVEKAMHEHDGQAQRRHDAVMSALTHR